MENGKTCAPPITLERNSYGLLTSINYIFSEIGLVNWRAMIKPEFLVPHKQIFEKRQKPVPKTIDGLEDKELLILLGGIKDLAQIRGFKEVKYQIVSPSMDYVAASCQISWIPNYETEGREVIFSAMGDAHAGNTNGFGKNFLAAIAENRAFVRAVRNFLKINIVSQEEIDGSSNNEDNSDMASSLLKETMNKFGVSFDLIKSKLIEEKFDGAEKFNSVEDIPRFKQFELIERIKKKAAEAAQKVS